MILQRFVPINTLDRIVTPGYTSHCSTTCVLIESTTGGGNVSNNTFSLLAQDRSRYLSLDIRSFIGERCDTEHVCHTGTLNTGSIVSPESFLRERSKGAWMDVPSEIRFLLRLSSIASKPCGAGHWRDTPYHAFRLSERPEGWAAGIGLDRARGIPAVLLCRYRGRSRGPIMER